MKFEIFLAWSESMSGDLSALFCDSIAKKLWKKNLIKIFLAPDRVPPASYFDLFFDEVKIGYLLR